MVLSVSRETVIFVAPRYPFIPDLIGVIASFLHPKDLVSFALLAKWYYQHITNEQSIFSRLPLKEQYKIFRKISKEWCDFIPTRPSRFFFFYYKNPLTLSTREALQALMNDNRESRNLLALQEVLNAHIEAFHDAKPQHFLKCWPDPLFSVALAQCASILLKGLVLCATVIIPIFIFFDRRYSNALTSKSSEAIIRVLQLDFKIGDFIIAASIHCRSALLYGEFSQFMARVGLGNYTRPALTACFNFMRTCFCSQTFDNNHTMVAKNDYFQVQVGCPKTCSSIDNITMWMMITGLVLSTIAIPLVLSYLLYVIEHLFIHRDTHGISRSMFQKPSLPTRDHVKAQMTVCSDFFKSVSAHIHSIHPPHSGKYKPN